MGIAIKRATNHEECAWYFSAVIKKGRYSTRRGPQYRRTNANTKWAPSYSFCDEIAVVHILQREELVAERAMVELCTPRCGSDKKGPLRMATTAAPLYGSPK